MSAASTDTTKLEKRVAECLKLTKVLEDEILRHLLQDVLFRLASPDGPSREAQLAEELLIAAVALSDALHDEENRGVKLHDRTDRAWRNLSLSIEDSRCATQESK